MSPPWVWDTGYRNKLQYYVNHLPMADVVCVCVGGGGGATPKHWEWVSHSGNSTKLTWRAFGAALHGKMGGGGEGGTSCVTN